jgi:hypothetical protein
VKEGLLGINPGGKAGTVYLNILPKRERPKERYFAALSKGLVY